jgi:membrane associated rhomboid family serine protease
MTRVRELAGPASVGLYLGALAAIQATGRPDWETLTSSADAVAHGKVWLLLSSGLVIDGVPWLQLAVLAAVMVYALVRLGAARLWTVGLSAHVGSALLAYAGLGAIWLVDPTQTNPEEPDYGVSVLFAGLLGALATSGGRRLALVIGVLSLVGFSIGLEDASWLANAEHVLGFAIGAGLNVVLTRRADTHHRARPRGRLAM